MATYTLFINNIPSDNTSNNKKILGNGNIVDLTLETPLELGEGNKYQIKLLTASIVYCEPNIKSANNKFRFKYGLDEVLENILFQQVYTQLKILIKLFLI